MYFYIQTHACANTHFLSLFIFHPPPHIGPSVLTYSSKDTAAHAQGNSNGCLAHTSWARVNKDTLTLLYTTSNHQGIISSGINHRHWSCFFQSPKEQSERERSLALEKTTRFSWWNLLYCNGKVKLPRQTKKYKWFSIIQQTATAAKHSQECYHSAKVF